MGIVVELLESRGIDFGVVINKAGGAYRGLYDYLEAHEIPIYGEILYKDSRARHYSNGELLVHHDDDFKQTLSAIADCVLEGDHHA